MIWRHLPASEPCAACTPTSIEIPAMASSSPRTSSPTGAYSSTAEAPTLPEQTAASPSELATVACRDLDAAAMGDDTVVEVAL